MATSFNGGISRGTRRKPPTYHKSPTNFITLYCIEFTSLWAVACPWSVVHSGYSGFFHHKNWSPWNSWNIAESGVKHNQINQSINNIFLFRIYRRCCCYNSCSFTNSELGCFSVLYKEATYRWVFINNNSRLFSSLVLFSAISTYVLYHDISHPGRAR